MRNIKYIGGVDKIVKKTGKRVKKADAPALWRLVFFTKPVDTLKGAVYHSHMHTGLFFRLSPRGGAAKKG